MSKICLFVFYFTGKVKSLIFKNLQIYIHIYMTLVLFTVGLKMLIDLTQTNKRLTANFIIAD